MLWGCVFILTVFLWYDALFCFRGQSSVKNLVIGAFPLKIYFIIIITITNYANVSLELATHLFCKLGIDFMALDTNLLKSPFKAKVPRPPTRPWHIM